MTRVRGGHDATVSIAYESEFGGGAGSTLYPIGKEASLGSLNSNHNLDPVYEPGSRDPDQHVEQEFEGSTSLEFTVSNPYFLGALISGGASGPWDGETPGTIAIVTGVDGVAERELSGGIVTSGTISASTGDRVTASLDVTYVDESRSSSVQSQPTEDNRALMWHDASLNVSGADLQIKRSFELSIENNSEPIHQLGSRFAGAYALRQRSITFDYGTIISNDALLSRHYGGGSSPSSRVTNTTGATIDLGDGAGSSMTIDVEGLLPDGYSVEGVGDVESDLEESMSEVASGVSATASGFGTA